MKRTQPSGPPERPAAHADDFLFLFALTCPAASMQRPRLALLHARHICLLLHLLVLGGAQHGVARARRCRRPPAAAALLLLLLDAAAASVWLVWSVMRVLGGEGG